MHFKRLTWDTDFFGFEVAELTGSDLTWMPHVYQRMAAENIELAYYFSEEKIDFPGNPLYVADLIDIKVTYLKPIVVSPVDNRITTYQNSFPDEKLQTLSVESGVYSRFKKDTRFPVEKYEALYKEWIINSVNKQIAEEVLICETDKEVAGFVTVGVKNERAELGIMAVDKAFRGRGIASALMKSAENLMAGRFGEIQIVTQQDNLRACSLYERFGYQLVHTEYVYHVWRNHNNHNK